MDESQGQNVPQREMTFGEKAVRANFNPGGNEAVNRVKALGAALIDYCDLMRRSDGPGGPDTYSGERARLASLAITAAEEAAMWGVKAATTGLS